MPDLKAWLTRQLPPPLRALGACAAALLLLVSPAKGEPGHVHLQDHPLVGSLWDTKSGQAANETDLVAAAMKADWILLGEGHHNPEHHLLQARIVSAIAEQGRRPALVWEMAEPEHGDALANARLDAVERLGDALDWEERGWFTWAIYQPIAEAALANDLKMYPGNPSRAMTRAVGRGEALPPEAQERLDWALDYDNDQKAALTDLLFVSHCRAVPKEALGAMADVQRLRDASMAASLREADAGEGAILIAGNEHVRKDRGVPWRLGGSAFSLGILEVEEGLIRPQDYPRFDPRIYDFVWFTALVEQEDHCAKFFGKKDG